MNGYESGGIFRPSITPVTSPPPVDTVRVLYPPGVTGAHNIVSDVTSSSSGGGRGGFHRNININEHGGGEMMVKKRGRPRKYGPNGFMPASDVGAGAAMTAKVAPVTATTAVVNGVIEQQPPHSAAAAAPPPVYVDPVSSVPMEDGFASVKKGRGRPPGSLNKKHKGESLGSAGFGFTPHIIDVQPGEDVLNRIMSFSQHGPRAICIMSGIGVLNNLTLRQSTTSGGTATYEGRFDIVALSGSFVLSEVYGQRTRTGGLSITVSGPDGRVFGGVVAGLLTAACPVQVMVGSFLPENCKEPVWPNHVDSSSVATKAIPANHDTGPSSSLTLSESSSEPGSPAVQ